MPKITWEKLDSEINGKQTNSKVWRTKIPGVGWSACTASRKKSTAVMALPWSIIGGTADSPSFRIPTMPGMEILCSKINNCSI